MSGIHLFISMSFDYCKIDLDVYVFRNVFKPNNEMYSHSIRQADYRHLVSGPTNKY